MKNARQTKILELISKKKIGNQEALIDALHQAGFTVTQATVSRDIRELGLIKVALDDGKYSYIPAAQAEKSRYSSGRFEMIFRESALKVDYAGHFVMIKCYSGMANAACEMFDAQSWENVVGTLSGDDTFLVLMRTEDAAAQMTQRLQAYLIH